MTNLFKRLKRPWLGGSVAAGGLGSLVLGAWMGGGFVSAHPVKTAPPLVSPFHVGQTVDFAAPVVETLSGHRTGLAHGQKATIIMAMASWCRFCGYEDRWVNPVLAHQPGVVVDIVDVSPQGGLATPGPRHPAFTGFDGQGGPLTTAGMIDTMRQYTQIYPLASPSIHVYVAPAATRSVWTVSHFPTMAFLNATGQVQAVPGGAPTRTQAVSILHAAEGASS